MAPCSVQTSEYTAPRRAASFSFSSFEENYFPIQVDAFFCVKKKVFFVDRPSLVGAPISFKAGEKGLKAAAAADIENTAGHRSPSFWRCNFNFGATAKPPAPTKKVQYEPERTDGLTCGLKIKPL